MDIVYIQGEVSVSDVHAALTDAPSYNSVRNLLKILENKGHLSHRVDGLRYVYKPQEAPATAARTALGRVVQTFFSGSVEKTVMTLLSSEETRLTREEAERIAALISSAKYRDAENGDNG